MRELDGTTGSVAMKERVCWHEKDKIIRYKGPKKKVKHPFSSSLLNKMLHFSSPHALQHVIFHGFHE